MMVEKRTIAEVALIIAFMISLGVNVVDTDEGYIPYTCDKVNVPDMMCYKLSRVNDDGIQRNCYYNRDKPASYKVCSTGWERIDVSDGEMTTCYNVVAYTDNGKFYCGVRADGEMDCVNQDLERVKI